MAVVVIHTFTFDRTAHDLYLQDRRKDVQLPIGFRVTLLTHWYG